MALTGSATLRWAKNLEADLGGYKVYYGTSPGVYSTFINVNFTATPNTPLYVVTGLANNTTYYLSVTAYDAVGNESPFAGEVAYTVSLSYTEVKLG